MSAKLLVYASNYSNRRKNDSFETGLVKIQKEIRLEEKTKYIQDKNLNKVDNETFRLNNKTKYPSTNNIRCRRDVTENIHNSN